VDAAVGVYTPKAGQGALQNLGTQVSGMASQGQGGADTNFIGGHPCGLICYRDLSGVFSASDDTKKENECNRPSRRPGCQRLVFAVIPHPDSAFGKIV